MLEFDVSRIIEEIKEEKEKEKIRRRTRNLHF